MGRTGSGKSTLAQAILLPLRYVLVIDSKGEFDLPNAEVISDPGRLSRIGKRHEYPIIFRPGEEFDNFSYYNEVCLWAFRRGNCTVYIDEVYDLMRHSYPAPGMTKLLKQGRSKKVRTIISTQRPRSIPISLLSESENFYSFELAMKADRQRMAELMGPRVLENPSKKYAFWWYNIYKGGEPSLKILQPSKGNR